MKNRIFSKIRSSCKFVAENSRHVFINNGLIEQYAQKLPISFARNAIMDVENHFCDGSVKTLEYFIILDCINFGSGYFSELEPAHGKAGYFLVAWHLREEFKRSSEISAQWLQDMTAEKCAEIFCQSLKNEAMRELMGLFSRALQELGNFVQSNFNGSFVELRNSADNSAAAMIDILVQMPFYQDYFSYSGQDIYLLKRAQITISDLFLAFSGADFGRFDDIDELTIFADNLVPHVLFCDGVMGYSPELARRIAAGELLDSGSLEEIELRACCVHAVELIRAELSRTGVTVSSQQLDYLLWNQGQQQKYREKPSHRTRCIYY